MRRCILEQKNDIAWWLVMPFGGGADHNTGGKGKKVLVCLAFFSRCKRNAQHGNENANQEFGAVVAAGYGAAPERACAQEH